MRIQVHHEMIKASAGSGKTYTLVNRFIQLLSLGVEPERIIALTFTRKAAGEFLQKIFLRLGEAAGSPGLAARLAAEIGSDKRDPDYYNGILTALIHRIGTLQLGTIDSFFARIVGVFPYELGLTRPHRLMDDFEQNLARELAMDRLLAPGDPEREFRLLQLYKQMTWGAEEKNVYGLFEDKLQECHNYFLENRDVGLWGSAQSIFQDPPWWIGQLPPPQELAERLTAGLGALGMTATMSDAFMKLVDEFATWEPGQPFKSETLLNRLFESREELPAGNAVIKFNRSIVEIPPELGEQLYRMLQSIVARAVTRQLLRTQSLGQLMAEFDALYGECVREAGSLVFADLPMLLIKGLCEGESVFRSEDLVYRLDARSDHWLLDEFQDTSRIQWKVLNAFVDEILQDNSGRRSFFYVGDAKQSIYGWRGGDARLFGEILHHYGRGGSIRESSLDTSWRSAPPVLDCVNRMFDAGIRPEVFGKQVAGRWASQWSVHRASPKTAGYPGYAAWGLVEGSEGTAAACVQLLRKLEPWNKDQSCAILVRRNKEVSELTQALRESGIPASMEGTARISRDNVVGNWILAFLHALARPGEVFPLEYLNVAGGPVDDEGLQRLAGLVRTDFSEHGYAEGIRRLLHHLRELVSSSEFLMQRAEQLLETAARFEASGVESLDKFITCLESASLTESTRKSQVQVMTVHKAKGLDFNIVLVAGFGGDPLAGTSSRSLHVHRNPDGEVDWLLELPVKLILEQEPLLLEASTAEHDDRIFEALCLLYVAMTRARHGLYCIAPVPERNSSQVTWHQLFQQSLGGGQERTDGEISWQWETGNPDWQARLTREPQEPVPVLNLQPMTRPWPEIRPVLRRMASPSQESHQGTRRSEVLRSGEGRKFGTLMHDFLATLEWIDPDHPAGLYRVLEGAPAAVAERCRALLETDLGKQVFTKPDCQHRLWREKPYVLRKGDQVANGIIDRAVILLDKSGQPECAVIYDYKTDALDPDRPAAEQLLEKYSLQLDRYREAVAVLTGLSRDSIRTVLVPV